MEHSSIAPPSIGAVHHSDCYAGAYAHVLMRQCYTYEHLWKDRGGLSACSSALLRFAERVSKAERLRENKSQTGALGLAMVPIWPIKHERVSPRVEPVSKSV